MSLGDCTSLVRVEQKARSKNTGGLAGYQTVLLGGFQLLQFIIIGLCDCSWETYVFN